MLQRKSLPNLSGFRRDGLRRWLAAGLGVWLLALQAPLPLVHFAGLAGGDPPAAGPERPPRWEFHPAATESHDAAHCLICQAFCRLLRVLVPADADSRPRPDEGSALAHRTTAPPAEAPCSGLAPSRAPPAAS